ncbi:hypothetical protein [Salisediminibacterium halotolerans]|nr:hypothetical protein [Salisediminibacterium haloalkalitolerans]
MIWNQLNKKDAEIIFSEWNEDRPLPSHEPSDGELRELLINDFQSVLDDLGLEEEDVSSKQNYRVDLEFGLKLYERLFSFQSFSIRTASDNDFWRYLSVSVIPDIVFLRWGLNESRYWKEPRRIWLRTIFWYIHLSWQGSLEETRRILYDNSTDDIVQLVERIGSNGYREKFSRALMKYYGSYDKENKSRGQSVFRKVMKLNTAKVETIEPELYAEGEEIYVRELFEYFEQE